MAISTELKENWKQDQAMLNKAISSLKKSIADHKAERKLEWRSYKIKVNDKLEKIERSLQKLSSLHKK
jgi:hypothetical protein